MHRFAHLANGCFARGDSTTHGVDFIGSFDDPRVLSNLLAAANLYAERIKCSKAGNLDAINSQPTIAAPMRA
ncbi:hypothetical protein D3C76_1824310 [compost metagenome]